MSNINELAEELRKIIADTTTSVESRASLIIDDLSGRYADLFATNPTAQAIGDMANKIKSSGATEGEDGVMWGEVIHLVHVLLDGV